MVSIHIQSPSNQGHPLSYGNTPHKIAIIGGGPRGFYCLESLSRALRCHPRTGPIEIDIFDSCPYIGSGNVYDVNQPDFLRMNFPNGKIDAWSHGEFRGKDELSLLSWLQASYPQWANPEGFSPRAVVGRYLHECFEIVRSSLPENVTLNVHHLHIADVKKCNSQWIISTADHRWVADDLVMTLGHEGWRSTNSLAEGDDRRLIERVFPVDSQLSRTRVASKIRVAIRGFGLTWIDASLALTEGRGGQFQPAVEDWTYDRSGDEPSKIYPYSRTGRPLLAKSIESQMELPPILSDIWQSGSEAILDAARSADPSQQVRDLWQWVTRTAGDVYQSIHPGLNSTLSKSRLNQWYKWWSNTFFSASEAYDLMKNSLKVGLGLAPPDEAWVWGETWRRIYPALVDRVSHGGISDEAWKLFRPITAEMERIAFGPPPENMIRMLALIDSEVIDLNFVKGAKLAVRPNQLELIRDGIVEEVDVAINAVIPSPYQIDPHGPLSRLIADKTISWQDRDIGLQIDQRGRPLSYPHENLAIFGRVTEGAVLGNDTLSRKLHPHIEIWAKETAKRIFLRKLSH